MARLIRILPTFWIWKLSFLRDLWELPPLVVFPFRVDPDAMNGYGVVGVMGFYFLLYKLCSVGLELIENSYDERCESSNQAGSNDNDSGKIFAPARGCWVRHRP